jgi:hypothetical protein
MPTDYIDLYCERIAPGLLGEPLNTLGNVGFFVAALWLALRLRREGRAQTDEWVLVTLAALVGVGSLIFHMFATRQTAVLDLVFIAIFVLMFLHRWLARIAGLGGGIASVGVIGLALAIAGVHLAAPRGLLNGSIIYVPVLVTLLGMAWWAWRQRHPTARFTTALVVVFSVAITCRTVDLAVCDAFPYGTHWLWHLLNATVIAIACRILRPRKR